MKRTFSLSVIITSGLLLLPVQAQTVSPEMSAHTPSEHLVDLSRSHWCYDCAVELIDTYKVMSGFSDHTFRGDRPMTRYELASTLLKAQKALFRKQGVSLAFPDKVFPQVILRESHWARKDVTELVSYRGLVSDWASDFRGDGIATREDLAYALSELIAAYTAQKGALAPPAERISALSVDLPQRSAHYAQIQQVLNQELMTLYADHTFRPDQPITRYTLAASLCRLFEQVR
jgi:hypothetical protein